jgi:hypothetical protein
MEVNVDGTGFEIVDKDGHGRPDDDDSVEAQTSVREFFAEPWPGESFLTIRRKLRRDLEEVGNAFMEVLRNTKDEIMFARHIDAKTIRLVKLDAPVPSIKPVVRGGVEIEAVLDVRERRYVQVIGGKYVFFKDFGAARDVDRDTGKWAAGGGKTPSDKKRVPAEKRGTELIHFINKKDPETPYGLPRWISSAPSVVGSRKAEEFNLDFFDSGGVPPLLVIVQGGRLAEDAERVLKENFMATGRSRHQAAVLEAFGTTGDIDSAQNVRVTIERFGSERQKDSMFEGYISRCDVRTQRSFRMPPLFLGLAQDQNFATAYASYTVAEAQVFAPERREFDEAINLKLMPHLPGGDKFVFRSLPVVAADMARQIEIMALVKDLVDPSEMVEEANSIANLSLKTRAVDDESPLDPAPPVEQPGSGDDVPPGPVGDRARGTRRDASVDEARPGSPLKKAELRGIVVMAQDIADQLSRGFRDDVEVRRFRECLKEISTLHPTQEETFLTLLARELYPDTSQDPEGAVALVGALLRQLSVQYGD